MVSHLPREALTWWSPWLAGVFGDTGEKEVRRYSAASITGLTDTNVLPLARFVNATQPVVVAKSV